MSKTNEYECEYVGHVQHTFMLWKTLETLISKTHGPRIGIKLGFPGSDGSGESPNRSIKAFDKK